MGGRVTYNVGCNVVMAIDVMLVEVGLRVRSVPPGPWRVVSFIYINICEGGVVWGGLGCWGGLINISILTITVRGSFAKLLKTRHSKHPSTRLEQRGNRAG